MRIGLEQERSERGSHPASQVCPCGLSRSGTGYTATSLAFLSIRVFSQSQKLIARSSRTQRACRDVLSRKEVIQPQVLLRLPCYDFTPIMNHTLDGCLLAVSTPASSAVHFRDVTGGVYKARERIHPHLLIGDY